MRTHRYRMTLLKIRKGYNVKYSHCKKNGKHHFWRIRTIYYIMFFNFRIPYLIMFGKTREFKISESRIIDSYE